MTANALRNIPAAAVLRDRCRSLGVPMWRCDSAGTIVSAPGEGGPIGLWLRSGAIARLVTGVAHAWAQADEQEITSAFPGCLLVPVPLVVRRERAGWLIAMALSPAALDDEWFAAGCMSAQLDVRALRSAMKLLARHNEDSARTLQQVLGLMLDDASQRTLDAETIAGFTRQLTDGFETIDLLYSLSRSMSDLSKPAEFARLVCQRLHESMSFGWVGAWLDADPKLSRLVGQKMFTSGTPSVPEQLLERSLATLAARALEDPRPRILSDIEGTLLQGNSQILVQPVVRAGRLMGALLCGDKGGDDPQVSSYDIHLVEAAAGYVSAYLDNASLYADQQAMFMGTLRAVTASIDAKDRYTRGHSERVALLSSQLARTIGLGTPAADRLHICGLVHDVGKIGVPEAVLCKPGRLTEEEFDAIKKHPEIGFHILKDIALLADILPGVLHHHERIDGRGYPHGLNGEAIPLFARIIALSDTFDAMSSTRSYRAAMPRDKVFAEMQRCAGAQLDAELVPVFVTMDFSEYDAMVLRHAAAEGALTDPPALRAAA